METKAINEPILGLISFTKYVPTDMSWGGTYASWYVGVSINSSYHGEFMVSIYGTDDSSLVRFFPTLEQALEVFNRITYLQSFRDLTDFTNDLPGSNNNGWPWARQTYTDEFAWPEPPEPECSDTPVPWATQC